MPIQRIPRYRLLLQEILKHTDPSKADHAALQVIAPSSLHFREPSTLSPRQLANATNPSTGTLTRRCLMPFAHGFSRIRPFLLPALSFEKWWPPL